MKRTFQIIISSLLVIVLVLGNAVTAFAHSGRTDSSGGHRDNKNKSGLGYYHYHCGGHPAHLHPDGYCRYTDIFPKSVSISVQNRTLRLGETTTFSVKVNPSNACNTDYDLTCNDTDVIRISGNTITAIGYGTAKIKAVSFNGKSKTITITVKKINASKITVTSPLKKDEIFYVGHSLQCNATIKPENVDDPSITWSSSDTNIATVDNHGNVQALNTGKVVISATAANGVSGKYKITIKEQAVQSVELPEENIEIPLGSKYNMSATVIPTNATFPEIKWTSSNPGIAEVDKGGTISAIAIGTAVITATSSNGMSDSIEIEVAEVIAEQLTILGKLKYFVGEEGLLSTAILPENATSQDIEWSTSNPSIVTINDNGKLICLSAGIATITATQKDVTATVEISVEEIEDLVGSQPQIPTSKDNQPRAWWSFIVDFFNWLFS